MLIFLSKGDDPVKSCDVYKEVGCSHVDGYLCDFPECSILKEYKDNGEKGWARNEED